MRKYLLPICLLALLLPACQTNVQTVWLDEMDTGRMETGWGEIRINQSVEGNPLTIAGVKYERGLGVHSIFKHMLNLDGNGRRFSAWVGVDDESGRLATVEFFVMGDKQILWQSGVMKPGDPAKEIDLDIKGIEKLALYISDGGDNINYDHADWIDARIDYVKSLPVPVDPPAQEAYILTPPVPDQPRINGPSVVGATPGKPFLYRVPVTGKAPVELIVNGLPAGLDFNPGSRVISGKAPAEGDYPLEIVARNEAGEDTAILMLKTGTGLALTPPLGWNSWNVWGLSVDQEKVKAAADAMISSGLADHGWSYINIDDGWEAAERTTSGELLANDKFPDMKALADYCHSFGLKLGIYSSPGDLTCGGYLGSYQHEYQDARTWARWGIGCDMTSLDAFTLNLLTNDEVLAVNQDPLGEQAVPVRQEPGVEIWARSLADGSKAVGLFYTGEQSAVEDNKWDGEVSGKQIKLNWAELGLSGEVQVRDLWRQQDLGSFGGSFTVTVPYHGVVLVRINQ